MHIGIEINKELIGTRVQSRYKTSLLGTIIDVNEGCNPSLIVKFDCKEFVSCVTPQDIYFIRQGERITMTEQHLSSKWEPALPAESHGTCGNVTVAFNHHGHAILCDFMTGIPDRLQSLATTLPPPRFFYRLACTLPCKAHYYGSEGDKVCVSVPLKHIATGEILHLYDWKGYMSFGTMHHNIRSMPQEFIDDLQELFTLLAGNCTHPYTGKVVI